MILRSEVIRDRLTHLRECVARLQALHESDATDPVVDWATERGLQLAAQSVFDIGNHILSNLGHRPLDYAAVPRRLVEEKVIAAKVAERLKGMAGFRNLLVHDYVRIDRARVREILATRLGDLLAFADAVEVWLENAS
jgi:uncharacterized protein YutE (UPF0331/DUF86 family)